MNRSLFSLSHVTLFCACNDEQSELSAGSVECVNGKIVSSHHIPHPSRRARDAESISGHPLPQSVRLSGCSHRPWDTKNIPMRRPPLPRWRLHVWWLPIWLKSIHPFFKSPNSQADASSAASGWARLPGHSSWRPPSCSDGSQAEPSLCPDTWSGGPALT
jgi:hypothetical protein